MYKQLYVHHTNPVYIMVFVCMCTCVHVCIPPLDPPFSARSHGDCAGLGLKDCCHGDKPVISLSTARINLATDGWPFSVISWSTHAHAHIIYIHHHRHHHHCFLHLCWHTHTSSTETRLSFSLYQSHYVGHISSSFQHHLCSSSY